MTQTEAWRIGLSWARFLAVTAQFALLVFVIRAFELVSPNFGDLMVFALGGFVVHHVLPKSLKIPCFVLISLWGLKMVAGGTVAVWVTACGLGLIGICHLPAPFGVRVALLLGAAVVISLLRVGQIVAPVNVAAWIVLGSMFMFRTMSYLYELKHKSAPFSLVRAMAYFFMIPNVCFVLFPLVDYRTFNASHYNDDWERIYGKGLHWILRGIIHLLLYRLIYQLVLINPLETTDLLSVARFMLGTYLLYLRVSGWFHVIVGLLHMYGFNLPETHHLYLLASSFTDFWRRINIYWKDFLLKVFFYPAYFRLKGLGPKWAMGLATLFAFFVTWLLHSYQFFWIRGEWLITWQDTLFWGLLALLVLVNALWELRAGAKRSAADVARTWQADAGIALRTIGTFVVICCLWTLWSCRSWEELAWLARSATNAPLYQVAIVVTGLAMLGLCGVWLGQGQSHRQQPAANSRRTPFFRTVGGLVTVSACLLLAVGTLPDAKALRIPIVGPVLVIAKTDTLNQSDRASRHRGYYEDLDVTRVDNEVRFLHSKSALQPWRSLAAQVQRSTGDFMLRECLPSTRVEYSLGTITINRWGMRDLEYEATKLANVSRVAFLGSSHEFGWGVSDGVSFEAQFEQLLNRGSTPNGKHYEILNFSINGYCILQQLHLVEHRISTFDPDAVLCVLNPNEEDFLANYLTEILSKQIPCPFNIVDQIAAETQVRSLESPNMIRATLKPHLHDILEWAMARIAETTRERGQTLIFVLRPSPDARIGVQQLRDDEFFHKVREFCKKHSVPTLDLTQAYRNVLRNQSLTIDESDGHTNGLGHQLLANELFRLAFEPDAGALWDLLKTNAITAYLHDGQDTDDRQ